MIKKPRNPATEVPLPGFEKFQTEFLASRKEEFVTLKLALQKEDFSTMIRLSHTWRGYAAPYGFGELGYLATELEEKANESELSACAALINDIEDYLASR